MDVRDIRTHQQLVDLNAVQSDLLAVNLISLDALRTAPAAFNVLRPLTRPQNWTCPLRDTLEEFSALSTSLIRIQNQLVTVVLPSNTLDDDVVGALIEMKMEGVRMKTTGKTFLKNIRRNSDLCRDIKKLGGALKELSDNVLSGSTPLDVFVAGIINLHEEIEAVLDSIMVF